MSRIVVLGGGVVGLSAAMLLARQGHRVTVLEHDGEPVPSSPEEAWQAWGRRGVAQLSIVRSTQLEPRQFAPLGVLDGPVHYPNRRSFD